MNRLILTLAAMTVSICGFSQIHFLKEKANIQQVRDFERNLQSEFVGFDTTKVAQDYFQGAVEDRAYYPIKFKRTNDDFFPELFASYYYDETSSDSTILCASYDWNIMNYVKNLNDDGHHFETEIKRKKEYLQKYKEIKAELVKNFGQPMEVEESKESNGYFYRLRWETQDLKVLLLFQFSTKHQSVREWKVGSYSIRVKIDYKQGGVSDTQLEADLDSVLAEGNLLYKYERAAWIASDLAMENQALREDYFSFFVYEEQEEIKAIILGRKSQNCIAEYSFATDFNKPKSVSLESRELLEKEKTLIELREKILENIADEKYEVTLPSGYTPNFILLPFEGRYKFYIIMGTSQRDIIPFGNDYLFIANKHGEIEDWKKFHSRIIPGHTQVDGKNVIEMIHSHLRTTPLITATDICTFMLYAPLYGIDKFSVYSPALGKYMKYSLKNNEITVE